MPNPADLQPLEVEGYTPKWSDVPEQFTEDGHHFEHARFELANGFQVSIVRTDLPPTSTGWENGHWEAAVTKVQTDPLMAMLTGLQYAPANEFDHLVTYESPDGFRVIGDLDNAALQNLLDTVSAAPEAVPPTPEENDALLSRVLGAIIAGEAEAETLDETE